MPSTSSTIEGGIHDRHIRIGRYRRIGDGQYVGGPLMRVERLLPRLRELAAEAGAELVLRRVETPEEAERERFLGSPTVRVDGRDVDPGAGMRSDYGLKCRIYRSDELGQSPVPPERWIRVALGTDRG